MPLNDFIKYDPKSGISISSFKEIQEQIRKSYSDIFGGEIDLSSSNPDGHIIDLFSRAIYEVVQKVQTIGNSFDVNLAEGDALDHIGAIVGYPRPPEASDEEYRKALKKADYTGLATFNAMLTYLRKTLECQNVSMFAYDDEDSEEQQSYKIPLHSLKVVIPENCTKTDEEIATAIWECKPAGIRTSGEKSVEIVDASGLKHNVKFGKIKTKEQTVKIIITKYAEETLPDDYEERIKKALTDWATENLTLGKDIIGQRLMAPIYESTPGIEFLTIEMPDEKGKKGPTIRVAPDEIASLKIESIELKK